jgi:hypothetical protein
LAINVIQGTSPLAFDLLLYGDTNPQNDYYIQNNLQSFGNTLTDLGKQFMESSKEIYDRINSSSALRMARAAIRSVAGMFNPNTILQIESLEQLRCASPLMQRYIMAEPTLRAAYQRQLVDGYSDTYYDPDPEGIKDTHYYYRMVMDGVGQEIIGEDGESEFIYKFYGHELREDDKELTPDQKFSVLHTWEYIKNCMAHREDPTNKYE